MTTELLIGGMTCASPGRATPRTIKGILFWAFAYNVAAVPLGLRRTNSLRLRRFGALASLGP